MSKYRTYARKYHFEAIRSSFIVVVVVIIIIRRKHSIVGILEFNPQLAGQDITPANLEFGSVVSRRRDRREKSFSGVSVLQNNQPTLNANYRASFTAIADDSNPSVCLKRKEFRSSITTRLFLH